MKTKLVILGALCGCGVLLQTQLEAEEGGSGHYLPGSMSSFVDSVPLRETFIARYNMVYYNGDRRLPQGRSTPQSEADAAHFYSAKEDALPYRTENS